MDRFRLNRTENDNGYQRRVWTPTLRSGFGRSVPSMRTEEIFSIMVCSVVVGFRRKGRQGKQRPRITQVNLGRPSSRALRQGGDGAASMASLIQAAISTARPRAMGSRPEVGSSRISSPGRGSGPRRAICSRRDCGGETARRPGLCLAAIVSTALRSERVLGADLERALGAGVDALTQAGDITLVGQVLDGGEDLELLVDGVAAGEVDHVVAWDQT